MPKVIFVAGFKHSYKSTIMKKAYIGLAILLMTGMLPVSSQAQILKNLVNNMTKNIGNKNGAQPASGKPDSTKGLSGYDSASLTQMLAKAGNANKSKPSISPADSAAAIKSFMTGTGGSGMFYQYNVTYTFSKKAGKDSTMKDTMQLSITDAHNARTDMGLLGSKVAVMGHAASPKYSIMLYPDSKTFRFNIIDTAAINGGGASYVATKIGTETIQGYSCIHARLTTTMQGGRTATTIIEDIWTSTDVPGYATFKKLASVQNVTPKMMQALDQAGCGGFFVKMTMQTNQMSMNMLLVTAARKNFPDSMFEIPAGYTQASQSNMFGNLVPQKPTH